MAIRITCPGCQTALTLEDKLRGKKVRCKACEKVLSIPAAAKAKALAGPPENDAVQDESRVKLRKAPVPAEDDAASEDDDRPAKKKKKKKKGSQGISALVLTGVAALVILLLLGGGLSAFFLLKPEQQKKQPEPQAKAPEPKEPDNRTPGRIVVPGIKEGNPAAKKGGTGVISNVRGAAYRAERRSELRQIGLSYVQYADEYKGANRNLQTWLEFIKTYGPIHESVKEGYYKMNFDARLEAGSVIAYERDIDVGQAHLCVRGDGSVDHVPLAELKTILGRDP